MASWVNSYCEQPDVEKWLIQTIESTSNPTIDNAAAWATERSVILTMLCAGWGLTITPATAVQGSTIESMLERASSIGAALDYTTAQQLGKQPSLSERVERLRLLWEEMVGTPDKNGELQGGLIQVAVENTVSLASDYILSGDTLPDPAAVIAPYNAPIGVKMTDTF